ncbi:MAG: nitrate/nitrite transporter [Dehalococcoidia bacterium]
MLASRWTILAVLFLARTSMGFQFQSIASVSPFLTDELSISYVQVGTLIGLFMAPGIIIAIPGGFLSKRFGDKRICAFGLALMVLGGIVAGAGQSYEVVFAGRLISGVGAVLFNVVLTKMVTDWFADREIITALGVILGSWPFGIALALVTQTLVADAYTWSAVMYLTSTACAISLAVVVMVYRNPPDTGASLEEAPVGYGLPLRELLPVSMAGLAWGAFF